MWQRLFQHHSDGVGTLQTRIRDMLVHAIHEGLMPPGSRVVSSRVLAAELKVSRATVTLALEHLCDTGVLLARERSGLYVNPALQTTRLAQTEASKTPARKPVAWAPRLRVRPSQQRNIAKPSDWQSLPYPFIYGQFDATLFPTADWRECALETLHVGAIRSWAPDHIDRDQEPLITQVQQRLLPARGIWAQRDEILITAGAQQATFLLAHLLVGPRTVVGVEDPGYPDARNNFLLRTASVRPLPVDSHGLVVNGAMAGCRYVYVTPSHQCPTTVTMPLERRQKLLEQAESHDVVLIEDDHESELNFFNKPTAALRSLDNSGRVIYVGSLSKTLAHGLRIGYVVAPPELIVELRALRRLVLRHPPANNEHTAALFIAHGFHELFMRRLNLAYRERSQLLREALNRYIPDCKVAQAEGGSALWLEMPRGVDTRALAAKALAHGVVIEPGGVFFATSRPARHFMRMGYSSIPLDRIDEGVRQLAGCLANR
ncbi:MAG: PLP-dependent aminotransferase family protein [Proteobacteria bacterium]|nr:PLP-dependent aminotransferase family protein [Pseudomonadota bacterium]